MKLPVVVDELVALYEMQEDVKKVSQRKYSRNRSSGMEREKTSIKYEKEGIHSN